MAHETLRTAELSIVVGDNEVGIGEHAGHRPGYNGVWCLTSVHAPENCFVPSLSGLNLEHLMDDLFMTEAGGEIFEPRQHPMTLQRLSDTSVRLLQQASLQLLAGDTVCVVVGGLHRCCTAAARG